MWIIVLATLDPASIFAVDFFFNLFILFFVKQAPCLRALIQMQRMPGQWNTLVGKDAYFQLVDMRALILKIRFWESTKKFGSFKILSLSPCSPGMSCEMCRAV